MTERFGVRFVTVNLGLITSYGVHEVGVTVCGVQNVLGVRAGCHQMALLTGEKKITHAYEVSSSLHPSALHGDPPGFRKKKVRSGTFFNRVVY